jgi:hypothetical protein
MPQAKKKAVSKKKKASSKQSARVPQKTAKKSTAAKEVFSKIIKRKHKIYIESAAFLPANSADGHVDLFQDGRHTATAGKSLSTAIVLPVGAVLKSISIHYTNSTPAPVLSFFLRKHADRHSPSGEIEMSFINLPPAILPPDNYLTVTDTTFPDAGLIRDRFLHYLEIPGTGDFGAGGKFTVRGVSLSYVY